MLTDEESEPLKPGYARIAAQAIVGIMNNLQNNQRAPLRFLAGCIL